MNMLGLLTFLSRSFGALDCSGAKNTFFGLEPWYQYLQMGDDGTGHCGVVNFTALGSNSSFLLIALAVVDDMLRIAAMIAVGYIIYGGITYVTSQGAPDQTSRGQSTIINALIGLVIAVLAAGIVNFIANKLGA